MSVAGLVAVSLHAVAFTTLAPGEHTLCAGNAYRITQADNYTLSTSGTSAINAALRVDFGDSGDTIVLCLKRCLTKTDALEDDLGYAPTLKVTGRGKLVIRHIGSASSYIRIVDNSSVNQPAIDLSEMTGGELRFERDKAVEKQYVLHIARAWCGNGTSETASASTSPIPLIKGNAAVDIVFARGVVVELWGASYVVEGNGKPKVLPPLLASGCRKLRVEQGALVKVNPYACSSNIVEKIKPIWTLSTLFENAPIALEGGTLQAVTSNSSSYVNLSNEKLTEAVGQANGEGVIFGKWIYTTGQLKGTEIPAACLNASKTLSKTQRTVDAQGRLVLDATLAPSVVYTEGSQAAAATIFGVRPQWTPDGCTVSIDFGLADMQVTKSASGDALELTLTVAVDLLDETANERAFFLRLMRTTDGAVTTTIYPTDGSTAALTTFTRIPGTNRFCAALTIPFPERVVGITTYTVRAYSEPPEA